MAKATAVCTCKICGRSFEKTAVKRNRREADSWAVWAVDYYDTCPDCLDEQTKRRAEESANTAAARGLPALTGSYKQVAWAEDIRTKARTDVDAWLDSMRAPLQATYTNAEERIMKVRAAVDGMFQTQTAAKFWIDRRSLDGYGWARLALGLTTD